MSLRARYADRITLRLVLHILVFSGIITLLVTGIQLYIDYRRDVAEIHRGLAGVRNSFLSSLSSALWIYNENWIRTQLEGILQVRDIEYVAVMENGEVRFSVGTDRTDRSIRRRYPLSYTYNDQQRRIGELVVVASLEGVYRRLRERVLVILATQGAKTFLVSGFMLMLFQVLVTRHLKTISEYTAGFRLESPPEPLRLKRRRRTDTGDEIDRMADAINRMTDRLRETYEALETELNNRRRAEAALAEANAALESRVAARTRDLETANAELSSEIEERRRTEETLARYQRIVASARELIALVDREGVVSVVNEEVGRVFAREPAAIIGYPLAALLGEAVFRKSIQAALADCLAGEVVKDQVWMDIGGKARCLDINYSPYHESGETADGVVIHARDVTQRKQMERYLHHTRRMEAIGDLAGGIAHEFNNALTVISGNAEMLLMDATEGRRIEKAKITAIQDSVARMSRHTDQLLAFAQGGKYRPRRISLNQLVTETLALLRHRLDSERTVDVDLYPAAGEVMADGTQLQMALTALIDNAIEATRPGGRIRVRTRAPGEGPIQSNGSPIDDRGEGFATVAVEDNGSGMDEATRERIFEPFFSTRFAGRGLSMAAVFGIIQNHDGWITVDSAPEKGTTVRIGLPAAESRPSAGEPPVDPANLVTPRSILIVEDEAHVITATSEMLRRLGHRPIEARTGAEAIRLARSSAFVIDAVILDIGLPDMPGDQVFSGIVSRRPDLPVIVCSGYATEGPVRRVLDGGARGFLAKPFTRARLTAQLQTIFNDPPTRPDGAKGEGP